MSSGNYTGPSYYTWFDYNRNEVIPGFNKKLPNKKVKARIAKLKKDIDKLEDKAARDYQSYRIQCMKEEKIL